MRGASNSRPRILFGIGGAGKVPARASATVSGRGDASTPETENLLLHDFTAAFSIASYFVIEAFSIGGKDMLRGRTDVPALEFVPQPVNVPFVQPPIRGKQSDVVLRVRNVTADPHFFVGMMHAEILSPAEAAQ